MVNINPLHTAHELETQLKDAGAEARSTGSPKLQCRADLACAGKLDEAESAAQEILVRYPEVQDGYGRLGMVYEARGHKKQETGIPGYPVRAQTFRAVRPRARRHLPAADVGIEPRAVEDS